METVKYCIRSLNPNDGPPITFYSMTARYPDDVTASAFIATLCTADDLGIALEGILDWKENGSRVFIPSLIIDDAAYSVECILDGTTTKGVLPPLPNRRFEIRAYGNRAEIGNGDTIIMEPMDLSDILDDLRNQERNQKSLMGYC